MVTIIGVTLLFCASLVGCSSSPSEEQLKQLSDLRNEVAQMEKDIAAKEQQKAALEQEVAGKNAKLKKCTDDQAVVKQRLGQ
jgi:septal ring factor EnvC (AmiA/AmiB activator)